jgi:hypothetical protein
VGADRRVCIRRVWQIGPDYPCMLVTYALIIVPSVLFLVLV